jgi:hypothetical protein
MRCLRVLPVVALFCALPARAVSHLRWARGRERLALEGGS